VARLREEEEAALEASMAAAEAAAAAAPPPEPTTTDGGSATETAACEAGAACDTSSNNNNSPETAAADGGAEEAWRLADADAAAAADGHEETAEERGRRIASQWTTDPEAAGEHGAHAAAEGEGEEAWDHHHADHDHDHHHHDDDHPLPDESDHDWSHTLGADAGAGSGEGGEDGGGYDGSEGPRPAAGIFGRVKAAARRLIAKVLPAGAASRFGGLGSSGGGGGGHHEPYVPPYVDPAPLSPADEAAARLREAETRLAELETEAAELARHRTLDFGPADVFLPLLGRCFEATAGIYTYEACPFGAAAQKEGYNRAGLGQWAGFAPAAAPGGGGGGAAAYSAALFANGDACWEAPARSLRVALACGQDTELFDASETAKCVYAASLRTPAACSAEGVAALAAEVSAQEALLAQLEAVVAAEAQAIAAGGGGAHDGSEL
jgi:protein kinase C substrate 80K-H